MNPIHAHFAHFHPNVIMVFGALLLFGVAGGMIANRIKWMPTITAFMLLGAPTSEGKGCFFIFGCGQKSELLDLTLYPVGLRVGFFCA